VPVTSDLAAAGAAIPVIIWLFLLFGRGGFWRIKPHLTSRDAALDTLRIAVVIPARNEAGVLGRTLGSLLAQSFEGDLKIFLVDDASTDGTSEIARSTAKHLQKTEQLTVITGRSLPQGWTGKVWALSQGLEQALLIKPDYIFLTDADIEHEPSSLERLAAQAQAESIDLASFMVKLRTETTAERAFIPAFVFFFLMLYPPRWVAKPKYKTAGAAGGAILIRPQALERAGGIQAIRGEIIDDCALARIVKRSGGRIWLGLAENARSIRGYGGVREIDQMIARTAFNQLGHSAFLLLVTIVGLLITYILPLLFAMFSKGFTAALGTMAWFMMSVAFLPMVRFYRQNPLWAAALPGIAAFYSFATVHSAFKYWSGRGGEWKGRVQDA
jgi:hopene-associated glycosyltransferase HpnB